MDRKFSMQAQRLTVVAAVKHFSYATLFLILSTLLAACSSSLKVEPANYNADPAKELAELKSAVEQARAENVNILSPTWFRKAEDTNAEAAALVKQSNDLREMLDTIQLGTTQLERARKFAAISRRELAGPFAAREAAMNAGAPELYAAEFESVEKKFIDLGKEIEANDLKDAQKGGRIVEARYRQLELRAIKQHMLGKARRLIVEAEAQKAVKLAPRSLAAAKKSLAETDVYITQNPYSKEVQTRAEDVLRKAEHIHIVLQQVNAWSEHSVEDQILNVENSITKVEALASGEDSKQRVQLLDDWFLTVMERVKAMRDSQRFLNTEVSNLQLELQKLGREKQQQEARQLAAAQVDRIITLFDSKEADVYRQGDTMLIRLKGLSFEVGKAYIPPQHYPLLTKLQKAMKIVGTQRVLIEGHTDLTGSLSFNRVLSQRRAQSVATYLINNGSISKSGVTVIGYGPDKPIAPNNTAEGRRLNRRIDITLVVK